MAGGGGGGGEGGVRIQPLHAPLPPPAPRMNVLRLLPGGGLGAGGTVVKDWCPRITREECRLYRGDRELDHTHTHTHTLTDTHTHTHTHTQFGGLSPFTSQGERLRGICIILVSSRYRAEHAVVDLPNKRQPTYRSDLFLGFP